MSLIVEGQLGGRISAVAQSGDVTFAGIGPRLVALDFFGQGAPHVLAQTPPFDGLVTAIAVADAAVLVTTAVVDGDGSPRPGPAAALHLLQTDGRTLTVVDSVSLDGAPAAVWTDGQVAAVATRRVVPSGDGDWAYDGGDLWTLDVRHGQQLRSIGHLTTTVPVALAGRRDMLLMLSVDLHQPDGGLSLLQAIDLEARAAPTVLGTLPLGPGSLRGGVALSPAHAFVTSNFPFPGLQAVAIADPANMHIVGALQQPGSDVAWSAGRAVLADQTFSQVVDVSDPTDMQITGSLPRAAKVSLNEARVVTSDLMRLGAVELHPSAFMNPTATWDTLATVTSLLQDDPWLYATVGSSFVQVIDAADLSQPVRGDVGVWEDGWCLCFTRMAQSGPTLAEVSVSSEPGDVKFADVQDPAHPRVVSRVDLHGRATGVGMDEGLAIVGTMPMCPLFGDEGTNAMLPVLLAHPDQPVPLREVPLAGAPAGVAMAGRIAYLLSDAGLEVFDMSYPAAPRRLAFLTDITSRRLAQCHGELRYQPIAVAGVRMVVATPGHVRLFDITQPANPVELWRTPIASVQAVTYASGLVFAAMSRTDGTDQLVIFDPASPNSGPVAHDDLPSPLTALVPFRSGVVLATKDAGVYGLQAVRSANHRSFMPFALSR